MPRGVYAQGYACPGACMCALDRGMHAWGVRDLTRPAGRGNDIIATYHKSVSLRILKTRNAMS